MNDEALNQPTATSLTLEKQRIVAANNTVLYLLAYFLCYLASQLVTGAAAFSARIPTVFYPGHHEFKIADSAWKRADIISVYSAGPVAALVLAFVSAALFFLFRKRRGLKKTFFLWSFLHGSNIFFGSLIVGAITKSGFWFALRWGGLGDSAVWVIVFIFIALLLVTGILAAPAFLFSCDSISLMQFKNRPKMLAATVIQPWLAGSFFLALLRLPDLHFHETLLFFTFMLMLLPAYFLNQDNFFSETVEMPQKTRLAHTAVVLLALAALAFRAALQNGIRIG